MEINKGEAQTLSPCSLPGGPVSAQSCKPKKEGYLIGGNVRPWAPVGVYFRVRPIDQSAPPLTFEPVSRLVSFDLSCLTATVRFFEQPLAHTN